MSQPVIVDLPHQLGKDAARTRIAGGIGKFAGFVPGGAIVDEQWEGDRLTFTVVAMGQRLINRLDVRDDHVHVEMDLPPMLTMFADRIRAKLAEKGPALLQ